MLLYSLLSCLTGPAALPSADSADPALPEGAGSDWLGIVQARIAAEGRAIQERDGAYAAELPSLGLEARFDAKGVVISGEEGEALSLRTLAWGRPGSLLPLDARAPAMGDCTVALDAAGDCIRRLEYADRELTEWWVGLGTGLEQGWTVEEAPGGEGPLVVEVAVEGALSIEGGGEEAGLTDAQGRAWDVGSIAAWDAEGEPLPARLVATEEGLRIEVDDGGAIYPVEIDPVYTTAAWTVVGGGDAVGSPLGYAVSGAGDVNGDGYDDVVVGAPYYGSLVGRAHVYHGSSSGLGSSASTTLTGEGRSNYFGYAVSAAGDVNGDGHDDVVVGAYGYSSNTGRAYLHLGSSSGLGSSASTTLTGESTHDSFGVAVSGAGDVNGDGYDDVVVGAPDYSSGTGRATVYLGSSSGLGSAASTTMTGDGFNDGLGRAVSGAGDVNGDGYDDVVIGASGHSSSSGRAAVYLGSSSGLGSAATTTLTGEDVANYFGQAVSRAGDVNGDGYDDVVVGALGYSSSTGRAYVYLGSSSGLGGSAGTTLTGESTDNKFGSAVAGAGDVNGDGYDDVFVGARGYSTGTGRATLYLGSSSGLRSSASTTLTGDSTDNDFGHAVAGAGDVNGDGYEDVVVGAPGYSAEAGRATVYLGSSGGLASTASTTWTGESTFNDFGVAVSEAGDVNGDGYDDVVVGALGYGWETGRAYLFLGSSSGLESRASTTLTGESMSSYFGGAVSGAGDVNGDGYDDVIIGAYRYGSNTGRAYVYLGSSSGLESTVATRLTGESSSDYFGMAVSGAGDVNGDGYDDVIVGASGYNSGTGRAYVYLGSSGGLEVSAGTTLTGEGTTNSFGEAVSGAGDVNGDGYDDVIIGAWRYGAYTGRAYLYHGSSSGLGSSASTTLTGDGINNTLGVAVSGAGDVNGDGYDDVVIGAPGHGSWRGRTTVYLGSASGLESSASTTLTGEDTYNSFGLTVGGAGDVNGDGYDDVVVGAYGYDSWTGRVTVYLGSSRGLGSSANTTLTGESIDDYFGGAVSGAGDVNGDGYDDVIVGADPVNTAYLYLGDADLVVDDDSDGIASELDCDDSDASVGEPTDIAYVDADDDGYGSGSAVTVCTGTAGYAVVDGDCDDGDAAYNPAAAETDCADPADYNCDGSTSYADADADGWAACEDCDDSDATVKPDGAERPGDGIDGDCDGLESCYVDADGDGYAPDGGATVESDDTDCADAGEASNTTPTGDCDDTSTSFHPGADESDCADPADHNCDGSTAYADADADGWAACQDCDDALGTVHPEVEEICNGVDDDCDGSIDQDPTDGSTWYADADGDGYTDPELSLVSCDQPEGYAAATEEDCDDQDPGSFPGASEVPDDGVDQDCDGDDLLTDEVDDTETPVDDTSKDEGKSPGRGCQTGDGGSSLAVLGLLLMALSRRRAAWA